jgi:3-dehydroquinate dehydratase type I
MQASVKICNVVEGDSLSIFLQNMEKAQGSSMIELRADSIKNFKQENVLNIVEKVKTQSIFTCRSVREGGKFSDAYSEQEKIINTAFVEKFNYVDVAYDNLLIEDLVPEQQKKLLVSYHNFKETPSSIDLMKVMEKMRANDPGIIKIATMVNTTQDIFTLIEVLKQKKAAEKFIVIGMGAKGKITRVMFPLMGSYLTYVSNGIPAPGIMSQKELETIYNIIYKS